MAMWAGASEGMAGDPHQRIRQLVLLENGSKAGNGNKAE